MNRPLTIVDIAGIRFRHDTVGTDDAADRHAAEHDVGALLGEVHRLASELVDRADELAALRATVAKLPKTADGVSIVPDVDPVYVVNGYGEIEETVCFRDESGWVVEVRVEHNERSYETWPVARGYSTRKAAEAKGETDG